MIQIYENYLRWPNQQEGLCANLILSGLNPLKGLFKVDSYIEERKQRNMWIAVFMFIFTVLSLTRQVMAITFLLMVLMVINKAKIYQKILVALAILFTTIFILPKVTIFNKMLNFTNEQMNANYDNIRLVAFNLNNSYHLRLVPLFYKNRTAG